MNWKGQLMYSSVFFNPTKDEKAYEELYSADRDTKIPDWSINESRKKSDWNCPDHWSICSTISRELNRNTGQRGYHPKQAHTQALIRRKASAKAIGGFNFECNSSNHEASSLLLSRILLASARSSSPPHPYILGNDDLTIFAQGEGF